ncbi:MAG: 50S ribosomal protein L17 [Tepidisphaeraceae bacterium]
MRGRQLSVDSEHRLAIRRNMAQSLIEHGRVRTTLPKAKEVQPFVEKLITAARKAVNAPDDEKGKLVKLNQRRKVISLLNNRRVTDENQDFVKNESGSYKTVVQKLFETVAPKFAQTNGGYTRIIKLAKHRIGDGGSLVLLELVGESSAPKGTVRKAAGLRRKRAARRVEYANKVLKEAKSKSEAKAE